MFDRLRRNFARWIAPPRQTRAYAAAKSSRLTAGWGSANSSADSELSMSLTALRARSRSLMRDAPYAKRARVIVTNNVVGSGVGMQAQVMNTRGELHSYVNAAIEDAWREWSKADQCHTGGVLHFSDFERACMAEVFTAGEVFIRLHRRPFGASKIPFALELIEAERLADEYSYPNAGAVGQRVDVRMGVEVDGYGRPQAYWVMDRHPGELRGNITSSTKMERVPASEILHLRIVDRWPMTRGEPWLHTVARKLNDMDGYSEAEIIAARGAASYMAFIETPDLDNPLGEKQSDGTQHMDLEPGAIDRLGPGEKLNFVSPNRPNPAMDPFMRMMLREVAAGIGVSYESLSRDYSQSNYSSSRLALLDDRDLWRVLQQWWARAFRAPLHEQWLQAAVLSRAIQAITVESYVLAPEKFTAVSWKFRGWSWVDPTKEVEAYKSAIRAGFMTVSKVISLTGGGDDIEDVIAERKRELAMFEEADIDVDTTVEEPEEPPEPAAAEPAEEPNDTEGEDAADAEEDQPPARIVNLRK